LVLYSSFTLPLELLLSGDVFIAAANHTSVLRGGSKLDIRDFNLETDGLSCFANFIKIQAARLIIARKAAGNGCFVHFSPSVLQAEGCHRNETLGSGAVRPWTIDVKLVGRAGSITVVAIVLTVNQ
jgi:hypothetical protein